MQLAPRLHIEKDLKLPKLTLQRWLRERCSQPGGPRRWAVAAELLNRWTRWYTAQEVRALLKLGRPPYQGLRGMNPAVKNGLHKHIVQERADIIARVETSLKHHARTHH